MGCRGTSLTTTTGALRAQENESVRRAFGSRVIERNPFAREIQVQTSEAPVPGPDRAVAAAAPASGGMDEEDAGSGAVAVEAAAAAQVAAELPAGSILGVAPEGGKGKGKKRGGRRAKK